MTREEAAKIMRDYEVNGCGYCHQGGDEVEEAFKMAIEALEQKLSEDCISRKAVLDALNKWDWQELYLPAHFKDMIDDLPSIQPKTELETWKGIHAQVTAPKGTFDKIWNEAEDNDEI